MVSKTIEVDSDMIDRSLESLAKTYTSARREPEENKER